MTTYTPAFVCVNVRVIRADGILGRVTQIRVYADLEETAAAVRCDVVWDDGTTSTVGPQRLVCPDFGVGTGNILAPL